MRYQAKRVPFSVDPCGWEIEIHDLGIALLPPDRRPEDFIEDSLQFFAYPASASGLSREELRDKLRSRMQAPLARAPDETPVTEAVCGAFSGWCCEFVGSNGVYWRLWELGLSGVELFIAYSTPSKLARDRRRHRAIVDKIVASLDEGQHAQPFP
jgi:hypothetical protein